MTVISNAHSQMSHGELEFGSVTVWLLARSGFCRVRCRQRPRYSTTT